MRIFPRTGKIIFLRHKKIFRGLEKVLEEREKFDFVLAKHAVSEGTKAMAKISARKLILCESIRLHFKRKNNNIKRKRFWVRQIFMERHSKGEFHVLVKELKLFDHEFFFKQFRMTPEKLEKFLTMVAPRITRSLLCREAIGLCITLCYLASGDSRGTIVASYRISPVTVSRIINKTCLEIWNSLLEEGYIAPPETPDDWKKIADD